MYVHKKSVYRCEKLAQQIYKKVFLHHKQIENIIRAFAITFRVELNLCIKKKLTIPGKILGLDTFLF